jgi:hypothetical protein
LQFSFLCRRHALRAAIKARLQYPVDFLMRLTSAIAVLTGSTGPGAYRIRDMSLEPLALTFALLVFWIGLGWSVIAVAEPEMQPLKALFLAPVTGVAVTILPAFWLNILGLPVGSFARPLMVVFCCIIVVAWTWRRPA